MSGNAWIALGIVATSIAAFAIPYGFSKRSKEHSRSDIAVGGDYVLGDKTEIGQVTQVHGDFVQILNASDANSTGVFVNLVLSMADYVSDTGSPNGHLDVDGYVEWMKGHPQGSHADIHAYFSDVLRRTDEQAQITRECVQTVLLAIQDHRSELEGIVKHTKMLPQMNSKLDYLVEQLSQNGPSNLREDQVAISAQVLDILTEGVVGSGVKVIMKRDVIGQEGSLMIVWLLGTVSPQMMLIDFVGGMDSNRLSVILNPDASISLRVYDAAGDKIEIKSRKYPPKDHLVIMAVWKDHDLSLWINGELEGIAAMDEAVDYLGPTLLFGIDMDGELSADAIRWTPEGQDVGLNFRKGGIWHESRFDAAMVWERALEEADIKTLADDPYVMFRRTTRD